MKNRNERLILYQLLLRQFANSGSPNLPGGNWSVNGSGTFDGLNSEILKSIHDLGCNAIWLTGILRHASRSDNPAAEKQLNHPSLVKGMAGSPYAIEDYFSTDPDLQSRPNDAWAEWKECAERIHAQGMKLIIDFVPNHCARNYQSPHARKAGLRDLGEGDRTDLAFHPGNHFYYLPGKPLELPAEARLGSSDEYYEFPARATGNDCFGSDPGIDDWFETIKLNYGLDFSTGKTYYSPIPPVWNYMKEVLLFWAEKGCDGFRCDMAEMVPIPFWKWVVDEVKAAYPELIFIAEVYNPELYRPFLDAGFDFLYDKAGTYDCFRAILEGHGDCRDLSGIWQQQEGIQHRMLRFLENHDEQRIASRFFAGNPFKAIPAFAAAAFSGKAGLMLYAGQEFGETAEGIQGFSGDDGRSSIFDYGCVPVVKKWLSGSISDCQNLTETEKLIRKEYALILKICQNEDAFSEGSFYDLQYANPLSEEYDAQKIWSFLRIGKSKKFIVIYVLSDFDKNIKIKIPANALQFSNISASQINCTLGAHSSFRYAKNLSDFPSGSSRIMAAGDGLEISIHGPAWSWHIFELK